MRNLAKACALIAVLITATAIYLNAQPPRPQINRPGANDKHIVDAAAADRGRKVWAAECIACHGGNARGTDKGVNLVRSDMTWRDRYGSQ